METWCFLSFLYLSSDHSTLNTHEKPVRLCARAAVAETGNMWLSLSSQSVSARGVLDSADG